MAHIFNETEVEWGSKSHRVFNLNEDVIKKDGWRAEGHVPLNQREHVVAGALWTEPAFSLWCAGSGAAGTGPSFLELYKAAGVDETISPATSAIYDCDGALTTNFTAVTIDQYIGDALKIPCGSCAIDLMQTFRPGEPSEMAWTGSGTYTEPTEAAGAATLETKAHPIAAKGLTVTLATETLVLKEVILRLNNTMNAPNYDIAATNGVTAPTLTDQFPTAELLAIVPAFATANYFSDFTAETKLAFSLVLGTVAGNILTVTADLYLTNYEEVTVDGIASIRLFAEHSWASGDTQLTWAYT